MAELAWRPRPRAFWGQLDDISLMAAVLLTYGLDPSYLDHFQDAYDEQPTVGEDLPSDFSERLEIIRSAVRAGKLKPIQHAYDRDGQIDVSHTRISTEAYCDWCVKRGFSHNLPARVGFGGHASDLATATDTASPIRPNDGLFDATAFDSLPTDTIAAMFRLEKDDEANQIIWNSLAKAALRNGLSSARTATGKGKAKSLFNPYTVGEWLIKHKGFAQDKVNRILIKNLPSRSAHVGDSIRELMAP